jgi:hypothetical protein
MCPIVMRSLGGVVCDPAMTCRGTIIGATAAAVVARRNWRRFTCERGAEGMVDTVFLPWDASVWLDTRRRR